MTIEKMNATKPLILIKTKIVIIMIQKISVE